MESSGSRSGAYQKITGETRLPARTCLSAAAPAALANGNPMRNRCRTPVAAQARDEHFRVVDGSKEDPVSAKLDEVVRQLSEIKMSLAVLVVQGAGNDRGTCPEMAEAPANNVSPYLTC